MLYHTGFNELISFNLLLAHRLIQSILDLLRKKKSESKVTFLEFSVVVIFEGIPMHLRFIQFH